MIDPSVWLQAVAVECHKLALNRGKYPPGWRPLNGARAIIEEALEWCEAADLADRGGAGDAREVEEYGDLLHAVLSIGFHRVIYVPDALKGAMDRNRERG